MHLETWGTPLAEGEGVRSTLLQGHAHCCENDDMVRARRHENNAFGFCWFLKRLKNCPGALANFQGPPNMFLVTSRRGFDEKKIVQGSHPTPHVPGPDHPLQSSRCRVRLQVCKRTSPDACVQGPTAPLHTSLLSGNPTCPRPGKPLMAASARQRPCANARLAQGQATTRGAPP